MTHPFQRVTSLILVLAMSFSLLCGSAWASEVTPDESETLLTVTSETTEEIQQAVAEPTEEDATDAASETTEEIQQAVAEPTEEDETDTASETAEEIQQAVAEPTEEDETDAECETAEEEPVDITPQADTSGTCGASATWEIDYNSQILTIRGTGATDDFLNLSDFVLSRDTDADAVLSTPNFKCPWKDWFGMIHHIVVEEGITYLGSGAFAGCYDAESVTLPSTLTGIGDMAFLLDISLQSIDIPSGVTSIGVGAFSRTSLTSVTLPASLTNFDLNAFSFASNLSDVKVENDNAMYSAQAGMLFNKDKTTLVYCPEGVIGPVTVLNGVTKIGNSAFAYCENVTSVTLPSTLTTIGESAFYGCSYLETIKLPAGVTTIGANAFSQTGLTAIELPKALSTLDISTLYGAEKLTSITVSGDNAVYSAKDDILYDKNQTTLLYCPVAKTGAVTLPSTVTQIADKAFYGSAVTELTIPSSVTKIGDSAFAQAGQLKKVTFKGKAPTISDNAFQGVTATVTYTTTQSGWDNDTKNNYGGTLTWNGYTPAPTQPKLSTVKNTSKGVLLKWNKMSGTSKYRIYRKKSGAKSWSKLKDTTSTSYTDTSAKSGTKYVYTVRCLNSKNEPTGSYDKTGTTILCLSEPKVPSLSCSTKGVTVKWSKVTGAAKYRVLRKADDEDEWQNVAETTSASVVDEDVEVGSKYTYTIVCITKDGKSQTSSYNTTGKTVQYYPVKSAVSSVTVVSGGIQVKWSKVANASKYRVYRKVGSATKWTKLKDVSGTSYTDKDVKAGTKYAYTVRAMDKDKVFVSSYDTTGKSVTYVKRVDIPEITSLTSSSSGVTVKWDAVSGAEKYRLYRKKSNETEWTALLNTTSTSYTDKNVVKGTTYDYLVRCITKDGKNFTSVFKNNSKTITYNYAPLAQPELSAVTNTATGVELQWKAVSGANTYILYRKTSSDSDWSELKTLSASNTSYIDTNVTSANRYTYTIRCTEADGTKSSYNNTGWSIIYIAQPKIVKVQGQAGSVTVEWNYVNGAYKYRVWRKENDGELVKVCDTANTSVTDTVPTEGNKYTYVIRCIASDGKTYTSSYDAKGVSIQL